jgi:hypothetical protein
MTQCIGGPAQEIAELYLTCGLSESDAAEFENHYFSCDLCHEHVLALQAVREELAREPATVVAPAHEARPVAPARSLGARLLAFPVSLAMLGSVAAALIVSVVFLNFQRSEHAIPPSRARASSVSSASLKVAVPDTGSTNPPESSSAAAKSSKEISTSGANIELASLADERIPGYQQPQLRGVDGTDADHLAFSTGMVAYAEDDCGGALENLAKVPATATDGIAARLYSGLCQIKRRELDAAEESLHAAIAAGESAQLETAEYFLAQVRLIRGDSAGAIDWLNQTIALHGDYEERAQKQLAILAHAKQISR